MSKQSVRSEPFHGQGETAQEYKYGNSCPKIVPQLRAPSEHFSRCNLNHDYLTEILPLFDSEFSPRNKLMLRRDHSQPDCLFVRRVCLYSADRWKEIGTERALLPRQMQ